MSIKDLFGKTSRNLEETVQDVESVAFVEEKSKADERYLPQIDFSDPKNFVYYGSAELYYDAAIRRIYEDYPYDGSKSEQIAFEEKASALERWVFENKYPKTTGHAQLGTTGDVTGTGFLSTNTPEYIRVWGGLHIDSSSDSLDYQIQNSAKYDADKNRTQNWNCNFEQGATIEFWMQKDSFTAGSNEVILDLWNNKSGNELGRILLYTFETSGTKKVYLRVENAGSVFQSQIQESNLDFQNWHHYAISMKQEGTDFQVRFYIDGEEDRLVTQAVSIGSIPGKIDGFIGALQTDYVNFVKTDGKLIAKLDEFRFWKTIRSSRQIKLNWFSAIGGGANTDDATTDLGVYLKFNEGIVGDAVIDAVVLDYSGRLANGLWVGYGDTNTPRSIESAMNSRGYTETPSPIIYKEHADVRSLISEMKEKGVVYDADRGQSFYRSMPTWLQEEDNGNFRIFSQILASYMDTLHVQIREMTELKAKRYPIEGIKASSIASELLKDRGFMVSNMFENNEVFEKLASVNLSDQQFETSIVEVKNTIYTNIYNNLEKIYKSKGTEGSIRNLIRCFGVDDELIRLNLYTDGGIQYFTDKSRPTSVKKKYVNFNNPSHFGASIFQAVTSTSNRSSISSAVDASRSAFTMEVDIVVPHKREVGDSGYFDTPFMSASVMGFHEASATLTDYAWQNNGNDLQVFLVKDDAQSSHAKFVMRNQANTISQESDYIYDIYENEHYNVALRIKPQTYPYAGGVTNTTPSYDIELYAVTTNFGQIENQVLLSQTISNNDGVALMNASKRIYVGAHTTDFTPSVQEYSDLQIGGVRAWLDYLDNDTVLQHNKDVLNYGMRSSIDGSNLYLIDDVQVPTQDLTILNWDFDTVSTSDISGEFEVEDTTSGSSDTIYGWIDDLVRREHKAKGANFPSESTSVVGYEFIESYKKQLPEVVYDALNIYIKGEQEVNFSDDDDVSDNLFIMEKSPASMVSEEMLKSFSTTLEFANLFARPIERFRVEYKDLARARQLFFDKVESDMDFDHFFEYFKWIDSSLSSMVNQLIPMSANFAGGIVDIIEPHILERDKYQRQVGLLTTITSTEASIRGVQEQKYNWRLGHAPLPAVLGDPTPEDQNSLWQKERRESEITHVVTTQNALTASNPIASFGTNGVYYDGGTYATRRLSKPYEMRIGFSNSIHGGTNYDKGKDRDFLRTAIELQSPIGISGAPQNVVTFGAGAGFGLNYDEMLRDKDQAGPSDLIKLDGFGIVGKYTDLSAMGHPPLDQQSAYLSRRKVSDIFIGNIVSSSVDDGYNAQVNALVNQGGYKEGTEIVNLHSDTTDITNEIPMQGPFTEAHIGGHQHRHISLNSYGKPERWPAQNSLNGLDHEFSRPEGWRFLIGQNPLAVIDANDPSLPVDTDGAIGFAPPDYGISRNNTFPDTDRLYAIYYREERAKRPINIKNIQTIIGTGSHGNYTHGYEVMSTFGDQGFFLRRSDNLLPTIISDVLPQTTNYYTLVSQFPSDVGNLFLGENSRYYDTGYWVPLVAGTSRIPGATATGGTFRILEYGNVTPGEFITIDSVVYEIDTNVEGGEVLSTNQTSNTVFFDELKTLLESNFIPNPGPNDDFVVTYAVDHDGGTLDTPAQPAGSPGQALAFGGVLTGAGLEYLNTPTWAPSSEHTVTTDPFTVSFFIKSPPQRIVQNPPPSMVSRPIYQTVRPHPNLPPGAKLPGPTLNLIRQGNEWKLRWTDVYVLNGATVGNQAGYEVIWEFDDFIGEAASVTNPTPPQYYADQMTHVIITSDGVRTTSPSVQPKVQIFINGVGQTWTTTATYPTGNHASPAINELYVACDSNQTRFLSQEGSHLQTTILDELMFFDMFVGDTQNTGNNAPTATAAVSEIWNNGFQLDYNNLNLISMPNTYGNLKAFYTFAEPNDSVANAGTIHCRISNDDLSVTNGTYATTETGGASYDQIGIASEGVGTAATPFIPGTREYWANFLIEPNPNRLPDSEGVFGNFNVAATAPNLSFDLTVSSINGVDPILATAPIPAYFVTGLTNIIDRQDRSTGSAHVIRSRFSAPGGPEINSTGYLDVASQEYSVHNSLNFRNLTVRGPSSGEYHEDVNNNIVQSTIRVNSHSNRTEGLRTLRSRHQGQFGIDSQHGSVSATNYVAEASMHKQHRNSREEITLVDNVSRGILFGNTATEFAEISNLPALGQVTTTTGGLSFSFWTKFDSVSRVNRGILDSENLIIYRYNSGVADKIIVKFKCATQPNDSWIGTEFDVQPFNLEQWSHFIISCDLLNLENCRMTISGVEASQGTTTGFSFVTANPIYPFEGYLRLGIATFQPTTSIYPLMGSLMNFSYFDSFILNSSEDVQILSDHDRLSEISKITSLVNFWYLGKLASNSAGTLIQANDTIPHLTEIESYHGRFAEPFIIQNAIASSGISISDGFYGFVTGERQGDKISDNDHFHRPLPSSDFGYSWINNATNGANAPAQHILGHAPRNGMMRTEIGYHDAIQFSLISAVECSDCFLEGYPRSFITMDINGSPNVFYRDQVDITVITTSGTPSHDTVYFTDLVNTTFAGEIIGCCDVETLEYRLQRINDNDPFLQTPPALPTLYYSPGCVVSREFTVSSCGSKTDTNLLIMNNVNTIQPTVQANVTYYNNSVNIQADVTTTSDLTLDAVSETGPTPGPGEVTLIQIGAIEFDAITSGICCDNPTYSTGVHDPSGVTYTPFQGTLPLSLTGGETFQYTPPDSNGLVSTIIRSFRVEYCNGLFTDDITITINNVSISTP